MDDTKAFEMGAPASRDRKRSSAIVPLNPDRPLRLFTVRRKRASRENNEAHFLGEADHSNDVASPDPSTDYGYLKHIQSFKDLCKPEDKSLKKKVR